MKLCLRWYHKNSYKIKSQVCLITRKPSELIRHSSDACLIVVIKRIGQTLLKNGSLSLPQEMALLIKVEAFISCRRVAEMSVWLTVVVNAKSGVFSFICNHI